MMNKTNIDKSLLMLLKNNIIIFSFWLSLFAMSCSQKNDFNQDAVKQKLNQQAGKDFNNKNYDQAIAKYKQAIAVTPNKIINYCGAGYAYLMKSKKDSALFYFNSAIGIDRNSHEGLAAIAMLKYDMGNQVDFKYYLNLAIESSFAKVKSSPSTISNKINNLFYEALLLDKDEFNKQVVQLANRVGLAYDIQNPSGTSFRLIDNIRKMDRKSFIDNFCNPIQSNKIQVK